MDIFEQCLFEELTAQYSRSGFSATDFEELYQRFCSLDYLEETTPYIWTMRYMGWGTKPEPDKVLKDIEELLGSADCHLKGLYYDLKLISGIHDSNAESELRRLIELGYTDEYLKEKSSIYSLNKNFEELEDKNESIESETFSECIKYKGMSFEGCGYYGLHFTSEDIDYLCARVFIEPVRSIKHLNVRSQIYVGDKPFSKVFCDEITLYPGDLSFTTSGWGNENFCCYNDGVYKWIVELDEKETYSQKFQFYDGKVDKRASYIKEIKLFASKASGALERDRKDYKTSFDSKALEYVYFKLLMDPPGETKNIQISIRVTCIEDNTLFYNNYVLQRLTSDCTACWNGIGFSEKGKWKKGLYDYLICVGKGAMYKGTFSVY